MARIMDKMPALQKMLEDGKLEQKLRAIAETGNMTFSVSLSQSNTSYSFSMSSPGGGNESYSKSVPFVPDTPSPLPPEETESPLPPE